MRIIPYLLLSLLLSACAHGPAPARVREEKNVAHFETKRSYVEDPAVVKRAARAVLDELSQESNPATTVSLRESGQAIRTGWVYGVSKTRKVEIKEQGKLRTQPLRVRRTYGYVITPGFNGANVELEVEEETMALNMRTGEERGWESARPDPAAYELLGRRLTDAIRRR